MRGYVFNIQRFSLHDGPGIRTTVFLKGCSLRCAWCHNPEGLHRQPEIQFTPSRCLGDMDCVRVCHQGAHEFVDGKHLFIRELCSVCGDCVDVCVTNALELTAREMTVEQVMLEVLADRAFYERSKGGVTLSGGDPLVQRAFSQAILEQCKAENIHTGLETTGNAPWEHLESLLPFVDLVMMDIKLMDEEKHKQFTGVSNIRILENARKLTERGTTLIFRLPIIPEVSDDIESVQSVAFFIHEIIQASQKIGKYTHEQPYLELLPFHRLAEGKYASLGKEYPMKGVQPPTTEQMVSLAQAGERCGIKVRIR
jgi:pyruvate formate lyase activating enzyme